MGGYFTTLFNARSLIILSSRLGCCLKSREREDVADFDVRADATMTMYILLIWQTINSRTNECKHHLTSNDSIQITA